MFLQVLVRQYHKIDTQAEAHHGRNLHSAFTRLDPLG